MFAVQLISATLCLILAVRALHAHGLSFENKAWMTVAWAIIITVLTFIIGRISA